MLLFLLWMGTRGLQTVTPPAQAQKQVAKTGVSEFEPECQILKPVGCAFHYTHRTASRKLCDWLLRLGASAWPMGEPIRIW